MPKPPRQKKKLLDIALTMAFFCASEVFGKAFACLQKHIFIVIYIIISKKNMDTSLQSISYFESVQTYLPCGWETLSISLATHYFVCNIVP